MCPQSNYDSEKSKVRLTNCREISQRTLRNILNRKKQDSFGFCKETRYPYDDFSHRKEDTIMGTEHVLCENNINLSRLRESI